MKHHRFFSWSWIIWAIVFVAFSMICCFIPLFQILGYEFSLVFACLGSIASVYIGVTTIKKKRLDLDSSELKTQQDNQLEKPQSFYPSSPSFVSSTFLSTLLQGEALLLIPLVISLLNSLRIRNCNYWAGFHFYLMLPVLSVICASALGVISGIFTKKTYRGLILGYSILLFFLVWSLWRVLTTPVVDAYDPFFGYYPGPIYDEKVELSVPFYWARLMHLSFVVGALALTTLWCQRKNFAKKNWFSQAKQNLVLGGFSIVGGFTLFMLRGFLGFAMSTQSLESALSLEKQTTHFLIRYEPGSWFAKDIDLIAKEHEFRYEQLRKTLQVEPNWHLPFFAQFLGFDVHDQPSPKIVSYLFNSAEQKKYFTGAKNVLIAKPYRREIYLNYREWPPEALKHELAHIFVGAKGGNWFHIASNPGVVEGFAEALSDSRTDLSLHQEVKSMRQEKNEPPLQELFGFSFWRFSGVRAYTVAGSFFRYLLDRFGPNPWLEVYSQNGTMTSFEKAYGISFSRLQTDWSHFIDEQPLTKSQQKVSQIYLNTPSIFEKRCAHELAARKEQIDKALDSRRFNEALVLLDALCKEDSHNLSHLSWKMDILVDHGYFAEAQKIAQEISQHPDRTSTQEVRAQEKLGDFAAMQKDYKTATEHYQKVLQLAQSKDKKRNVQAKLIILEHPKSVIPLLTYLIRFPKKLPDRDPFLSTAAENMYVLMKACQAEPSFGLCHYLLGRALFSEKKYDDAIDELKLSIAQGLPNDEFLWQTQFTLAKAYFFFGQYEEAEKAFQTLLSLTPFDQAGLRQQTQDFIERAQSWNQ